MEYRRDAFQAIADPTRRQIISLIAERSMTVNAIADHFDISRPAVSKHVRILDECGLIMIRNQGRERVCTAKLKKLKEVSDWTLQYCEFWDDKLAKLKKLVERK